MAPRQPSAAVLAGRGRRAAAGATRNSRVQWFIKNVANKVELTMRQRVKLATAIVKDSTIRNISKSVTRSTGPRGGRVVTNRSKEGEFPRADTSQLLKTIFSTVSSGPSPEGFVGTPLSYGLILETRMDRSFLVRTLHEELGNIKRILTGPIR